MIIFYPSKETILSLDRHSFTINLTPFKETILLLSENFTNGIITIFSKTLLFIPLGIFIPCLTNKTKSSFYIILTTLCVSFIIELNQIILSDIGNIDNIILSIIGSLIGFYLFKHKNSNFSLSYKDNTSAFFKINSIAFSFSLIFHTYLHVNDYNIIKNKVIASSSIPVMLDEFNFEIVASIEDKFSKVYMSKDKNDELYIRKFIKKLDKFLDSGNIKISPKSKYYYIDNKQNIVYFEELNSTPKKITTLRLFLKSNSFSTLTLSYNNQATEVQISKGYSIIDVNISNFNISFKDSEDLNFKFS